MEAVSGHLRSLSADELGFVHVRVVAAHLEPDFHLVRYRDLVVSGCINLDLEDQATFGLHSDEEWPCAVWADPLDDGPLFLPWLAAEAWSKET